MTVSNSTMTANVGDFVKIKSSRVCRLHVASKIVLQILGSAYIIYVQCTSSRSRNFTLMFVSRTPELIYMYSTSQKF